MSGSPFSHLSELDIISVPDTDNTERSMSPSTPIIQAPSYGHYLDDYGGDMVTIQVEDRLYRAPQADFTGSTFPTIRTRSSVSLGQGNPDYEDLLIISGVNTFEMEAFLDISQGRVVDGPRPFTFHHLFGALRLAKLWNFDDLTTYITKELDAMATERDPVGCIEATNLKIYDVKDWALKACKVLIERDTPLSLEEASRLSLSQTLTICNLKIARKACISCTDKSDCDTEAALKEHAALFTPQVEGPVVKPLAQNPEKHPQHYQPDPQDLLFGDRLYRLPLKVVFGSDWADENKHLVPHRLNPRPEVTHRTISAFLKIAKTKIWMPTPQASFTEWSEALYFATQYGLSKARKYIINTLAEAGCLPKDDPTAVIQLAECCKVNAPWLLPQYVAVCERSDPLSDTEAERLGIPTFAAISRIREKRATLEAQRKGGKEALTASCCGKPRIQMTQTRYGSSSTTVSCACAPYAPPVTPATPDMIKDEPYLAKRTAVTDGA